MRGSQIEDLYRLSPMQEGMLFHSLYAEGADIYFRQLSYTIHGDLNVAAFERAWQQVLNRHPVLRTSFHWQALEKPLQAVHRELRLPLEMFDWRRMPAAEQEQQLEALMAVEAKHRFDLSRPPLMRLALIRVSDNTFHLIWSYHHLLMDGWSKYSILKEVLTLYDAYRQGRDIRLDPPSPYKDYIAWLRRQQPSAPENFWRQWLKGVTAPTPLIGAQPKISAIGREEVYAEQQLQLSVAATAALQSFARQYQLTMSVLLQGAWALLLSRYSGEEDVVFGVAVSGRSALLQGIEAMIGLFINTLPMRTAVPSDAPLLPWLKALQNRQTELSSYEHCSLAEIQGWSEVPRGQPLFESLVVFDNYPVDASMQTQENLRFTRLGKVERNNYALTLVAGVSHHLEISIPYDTGRFDFDLIRRLLEQLQALLEGLPSGHDQRLRELPWLTEAERKQVLVEWNRGQAVEAVDQTIHEAFERQVKETPEAAAVEFGAAHLTYWTLNQRANQLAGHLRALGVGPEAPVGICVERSLEMMVGLLGILKSGGVYIPLDPAYPQERLSFILERLEIPVLLTQQQLLFQLPPYAAASEIICLDSDWETIASQSGEDRDSQATGDNLAYLIYTSGSTGDPKGAGIPHGAAVKHLLAARLEFGLNQDDRVLQFASMSFDVSLEQAFAPLLSGAAIVLREQEPWGREEFWNRARLHGLTVINVPPAYWGQIIPDRAASRDPEVARQLKLVIIGGDAIRPEMVRRWRQSSLNGGRLLNAYGPTETIITATYFEIPATAEAEAAPGSVSIGRALGHRRIYILDSAGQPVPVGVAGELHIGGPLLARGYIDWPELTAEKFIPDPFGTEPGARMYRTGDVARYWNDGNLDFLGRIDRQVKVRGFRIELGEIEAALVSHHELREAIVVTRELEAGDKQLVAYVVAKQPLAAAGLKDYLRQKLPEHMIPAAFVMLDELPLAPNGKIDRHALPAPDQSNLELEDSFVPPGTPLEETLAEIWQRALGLERIGIHDNFFELGGDSILSIQITARANQAGLALTPKHLFQHPTIAGIAAAISPGPELTAGDQGAATTDDLTGDFSLARIEPAMLERIIRTRPKIEDLYPLTPMQQGMLFHSLYQPGSGAYIATIHWRVRGAFDIESFERAWQRLIDRHSVLRTSFIWDQADDPLQAVHQTAELTIRRENWRGLSQTEQQQRLEEYLRAERSRGFDMSAPPLLRVAVIQTAGDTHYVAWTHHHILTDGWCMTVMVKELFAFYQAARQGHEERLTPSRPYRDYIEWLQRQDVKKAETYWRELLRGFMAPTPLTVNRESASQGEPDTAEERERWLSEDLTVQLRSFARRHQLTPGTLMLGAWALLLSCYSGENDVLFGATVSGRPAELTGIEEMIGLFINTLPVRVQIEPRQSVSEWLWQLQAQAVETRQYEYSSLVDIQGWSEIGRGVSLFESIVVVENHPTDASFEAQIERDYQLRVDDGRVTDRPDYPLVLIVGRGVQLKLRLAYDNRRFDAGTIDRMLKHLESLLAGLVSEARRNLSQLSLLTNEERRQLLVEWNGVRTGEVRDESLHQLFERQVASAPEATALVFQDGHLSYRELDRLADRLAYRLRRLGVAAGAFVGVMMERSAEMVVALLGVLKTGAAYVPLDPAYPRERLSFILADVAPKALLTQPHLTALTAEYGGHVLTVEPASAPDREPQDEAGDENQSGDAVGENPAYVIYTSGSTGSPKGCVITHRNIVRLMKNALRRFDFGPHDVWVVAHSFAFDFSVWEMYGALLYGGQVVIASREAAQDATAFRELIRRHSVTVLNQTPAAFYQLIEVELANESHHLDEHLRYVIFGGDRLEPVYLRAWADLYPLEKIRLVNMYGITETTVHVSYGPITNEHVFGGDQFNPIGLPLPDTQVYVCDEKMNLQPVGVPGEFYIGGAGVCGGYLGRPELSAARFLPSPFGAGERLYRSGDLGRWRPDGTLEYFSRNDDQVQIRGFRVELGEIQSVLASHAAVREVVVTVWRPDDNLSAGMDQRLVAYIVSKRSGELPVAELRAYLKEKLPDYMTPSSFVRLDQIPRSPNGKLDRRALPEPEINNRRSGILRDMPRTPQEELLADIWARVLKLEEVGVHDNFFDLGGHSLLATRVINRVQETFGVRLPLRQLFDAPTIAGFAGAVEAARREGRVRHAPPIKAVARDRALPLSFPQQRLWFNEQLSPGNQIYHVPATLSLNGRLDIQALEKSLGEIARRHEILRTSFSQVSGEPVQIISPPDDFKLKIRDLSSLIMAEREREAASLVAAERQQPFDLERGPLLRAALLKMDEQQHLFIVCMHHIITDGWSMGILVRELAAIYHAYLLGQASPLAPPTIQYADFAIWQREWLQGEVLEEQLTYWRRQLEGAPPVLELPADFPRPEAPTFRGAKQYIAFSRSFTDDLLAFSRQHGVTLFMTLLAAFQTFLRRHTGQDDIVVGTDDASRTSAETEDLIGFFVNQLALRTDLSGNPRFDELLCRVREVTLESFAHSGVPFDEIVRAVNPGRSLKHAPIFQVKIVLQNTPAEELELPGLTLKPLPAQEAPAKFDLTPLFRIGPDGLEGWIEYNRDLFKDSTVAHFARQLEAILASVVECPGITLDELNRNLVEIDQRRRALEQSERKATRHRKFNAIKPKEFSLVEREPVSVSLLKEGENLPLIIQSAAENIDLTNWVAGNRDFITTRLSKHGAILFRDFEINTSTQFERLAASISPELFNENGEHPRGNIGGHIYTPVFYPPDKQLLWHNENSFNHRWPMKIWFYCAHPPEQGGETPLVDSRRVFDLIDPLVRDRFMKKGVMYVRNYGSGVGLDWQTVLRTTDRAEAEEYLRANLMEFEWKEGGRLRTRCVRPAAARHPVTGEFVWFNQAQHWHLSCLDPENRAAILTTFSEDDYPRNCYYGDGSPIEDSVMEEILGVYRQLEVCFPWQRRDLVMLDNMLTAHGRNPFMGERKLFVAMGEMMSYEEVRGAVAS